MGRKTLALGMALLVCSTGSAWAGSNDDALQAKVQRLENLVTQQSHQIQQLQSAAGENWLSEQRAEQVKSLVRDVLADADTRASLLENGLSAGHNGKNFYLASEDGNFLLAVRGYMQLRYIFNSRDGGRNNPATGPAAARAPGVSATTFDNEEGGFELSRAKLTFSGHVIDPRLQYSLGLKTDSNSGEVLLDHAVFCYALTSNVKVWGGQTKAAMLREENIEATHQLAVDRSLVNEMFSTGYVQGIGAIWTATEDLTLQAALHDGSRSGESGDLANTSNPGMSFDSDSTDFAIALRADYKVWGDWEQAKDYSAWSGEEKALFIGAAFNWDNVEHGSTGTTALHDLADDIFTWTVDAQLEVNGFNASIAFVSQHFDVANSNPSAYGGNITNQGLVVQAGQFILPDQFEVFTRYELLLIDDNNATLASTGDIDNINILTFGGNYYFSRHNAKFTLDTVVALNALDTRHIQSPSVSPRSLGLLHDKDGEDPQIAVRAQFQLMF